MKLIGSIVAVVAVGGGWFAYSEYAGGGAGAEFITKPVTRGDIVRTVSAVGTLEPLTNTIVGSEVSGRILEWRADFNAAVRKGDVLALLDPERFQTAHDRASAELALSQARAEELNVRYKDAERERKRIEALRERNNASENELLVAQAEEDATRAAWEGSKASVEAAKAALQSAAVDLENTIIRSPMDGVVIARNIDVGQTVAASFTAPELFVIANDLTRMQVKGSVAESDIGVVTENMPVTFTVDAYPRRTFSGRVSQVRYNGIIVDGVVTYETLIEVSNDDLALRPGMTANVTFEVERVKAVLRLPNSALRFDPNPPDLSGVPSGPPVPTKPTVYVFKNGKPVAVEVEIGLTDGSLTEMLGGDLQENDPVITERNWRAGGGVADPSRMLQRG